MHSLRIDPVGLQGREEDQNARNPAYPVVQGLWAEIHAKEPEAG